MRKPAPLNVYFPKLDPFCASCAFSWLHFSLRSNLWNLRNLRTNLRAFDDIGLPGFQFIQDEIEYNTRTHHSNQDVFDRIQADDMKQAATIIPAFVYNTAMRDEKLPRKPAPGQR